MDTIKINTPCGEIEGIDEHGIHCFLGVKYADARRFEYPKEITHWDGVYQALKYGPAPILTDFALYNMTRNNDFDCSKARQELGFSCRPFEETIRDEVNWLKEMEENASGQCEEADEKTEKAVEEIKNSNYLESLDGAQLVPKPTNRVMNSSIK